MPTVFIKNPHFDEWCEKRGKERCLELAQEVAPRIVENVPVRKKGYFKGHYEAHATETEKGARVHIDSPYWHWLEYGTVYWHPYKPIARALESVGLHMRDD